MQIPASQKATPAALWPTRLATISSPEHPYDDGSHLYLTYLEIPDLDGIVAIRGSVDDAMRAAQLMSTSAAVAVIEFGGGHAVAPVEEVLWYSREGVVKRSPLAADTFPQVHMLSDVDPRLVAIVQGAAILHP
jgi:hypothetical protein